MKDTILNIVNHNPEIPPMPNFDKYQVKIPVLTDMHLLYKEPNNRTNFTLTTLSYLLNLKDIFDKNGIDYAIQAGDLHDRGEKVTDTTMRNIVEKTLVDLRETVKEFFIVMGNHELTYINNNLFFNYTKIESNFLNKSLANKRTLYPNMPIFRALDKISFGDVNIHFMHYDPQGNYVIEDEGFNICIFHDDIISFDSKQELYHHKLGHGISITDTNLMQNVDIAIFAHIHTPLLPFRLNNSRNTLAITPGSLCQRTTAETHSKVDIPVICLNEEGVTIEYIPFNLGNVKETLIDEIVEQQKKVRKTTKALKEFTEVHSKAQDLEDLLMSLPNEQAVIIRDSISELNPKTLVEYFSR